jgi:hypothetical protein
MIFPVLGLQAPLTFWCQRAVTQLVARSRGSAPLFHADSGGDLLRHLMAVETSPVLTSSRPDRLVRDALLGSGRRYVLSAAPPHASVEHLVRHGAGPLDATRGVLADLAALFTLAGPEGGAVVSQDDVTKDASGTVGRIARHLGLDCSPQDASAIAEIISSEIAGTTISAVLSSDADREDQAAVAGALSGLSMALSDSRYDRLVATRRFFAETVTGSAPLEPIDATGRNRLLIYGPFLCLPVGDWTARCVYSFSPGLIGTPMTVDVVHFVGGFTELARTSFMVTSAGRFDVDVRFTHTEPSAVLEIRLFSEKAIFDGTISLGYVEFRRSEEGQSASEPIPRPIGNVSATV